ncbi:hypothetical protein CPB86DRAFT_695325 [Serendipita vermifera]|nr:hypothetical protein CPB86DRAFT_695325 [Serendipita vermifera]
MASADQALLDQIQRLSGALQRARDTPQVPPSNHHDYPKFSTFRGRGRYPYNKFVQTRYTPSTTKSVEIDGHVFQASSNKLTRQEVSDNQNVPTPSSSASQIRPKPSAPSTWNRYSAQQSGIRVYKPRIAGRRHHPNMSLVLNKVNNMFSKRLKPAKQCPFFTRTGTCHRGKSCRYHHDPEKVAICPRYLAGECPSTAETCLLSHSATLNRVPPCVHFQNNGRCKNGDNCLYPHVRVGNKSSVCRDFAVLGYCEKGIDCEEAHIRECPDFATNGVCKNPKCKLPHVIRANRRRDKEKETNSTTSPTKPTTTREPPSKPAENEHASVQPSTDVPQLPLNGVNYTFEGGDEFIPLTFVESEDEEGEGEDEDEDEADSNEDSEEEEKSVDPESPDEPGPNPGIKVFS